MTKARTGFQLLAKSTACSGSFPAVPFAIWWIFEPVGSHGEIDHVQNGPQLRYSYYVTWDAQRPAEGSDPTLLQGAVRRYHPRYDEGGAHLKSSVNVLTTLDLNAEHNSIIRHLLSVQAPHRTQHCYIHPNGSGSVTRIIPPTFQSGVSVDIIECNQTPALLSARSLECVTHSLPFILKVCKLVFKTTAVCTV